MSVQATQAQVDAARVYERLFVPAEFQEWAQRVVDAARLAPGQKVLDVACGTGVVARTAVGKVGVPALVSGLDVDAGMIAVAASIEPGIQYRHGNAESLPYPDVTFDAVVSQFGLMFFSDRARALQEMQRVLRPGGRLAVAVWDTLQNTPAYDALVSLLDRVAGSQAADALTAPFALGDKKELAELFASAGMPDATIETAVGISRFPAIRTMVEADLRGWLPVMGVVLPERQIEAILGEAEQVLRDYRLATGEVRFESPGHIVTLTKRKL